LVHNKETIASQEFHVCFEAQLEMSLTFAILLRITIITPTWKWNIHSTSNSTSATTIWLMGQEKNLPQENLQKERKTLLLGLRKCYDICNVFWC
jgi:hypothetical protein